MSLSADIPLARVRADRLHKALAPGGNGATHGVVMTKPFAVELILDLAGYTADRDLAQMSLLEPACGHGAFLVSAMARLLKAAERSGRNPATLQNAIQAYDIDDEHVARTRKVLRDALVSQGIPRLVANRLIKAWVRKEDFLLASMDRKFDFVVGNPPYTRTAHVTQEVQTEYRRRYRTLSGHTDLYVAFIERGLSLLSESGVLSFICSNRWLLNRYGAPLRQLIASQYQVRCYVDMQASSPFESEVFAYPSIFVLAREKGSATSIVTMRSRSSEAWSGIARALDGTGPVDSGLAIFKHDNWFQGDEPWVLGPKENLATLRALETRFAPVQASVHLGIGASTGNDGIYLVNRDTDVEADRLVPVVIREDLRDGRIADSGRFVINTFDASGHLIDLNVYPRLRSYFGAHSARIRARHVARKYPRSWFRTIDRVYPELVRVPKLLIPDMATSNEFILDKGQYHPHHTLYFATSETWDMEVLGGLLSSRLALYFVWSYSVRMRGGYLRFIVQNLRRIRLPDPKEIRTCVGEAIKLAFRNREFERLDALALEAYGMKSVPSFDFPDSRG